MTHGGSAPGLLATHPMRPPSLAPCLVTLLLLVGCGPDDLPDLGTSAQDLAVAGPWSIPPDVVAAGDTQYVEYTGAGPWVGTSGCEGGMTDGASEFRSFLYSVFPQAWHIGGYACRSIRGNDSVMSVHSTGRALDIHIELDSSDADNGLGDAVGNWLIENCESIGIQYIIWDQWTWGSHRPAGEKHRAYGGSNPHLDHLHIELSVAAGRRETDWFSGPREAPKNPECQTLAAGGGVLEEGDPCVDIFGPSQYWRVESDAGHGGSLLWTNAFENDSPSNWIRYNLDLAEAGKYLVEFHGVPQFAVYDDVRYEVQHDGQTTVVQVNQSGADGWAPIGEFEFAAGGGQWVSQFDDTASPVAADQHIIADGLRLTRIPDPVDPTDPTDPVNPTDPVDPGTVQPARGQLDPWGVVHDDEPAPIDPTDSNLGGGGAGAGCTTASGPASLGLVVLVLLGLVRRRRYLIE